MLTFGFASQDVRGAPLDLEEEYTKKESTESPGLVFPAFLGKVRAPILLLASVRAGDLTWPVLL
jgi:hypothetical protein